MPENQLLAKKHVTLALMVLSGLFHLYELVRARTSLYTGKLKKVLCKFTDVPLYDLAFRLSFGASMKTIHLDTHRARVQLTRIMIYRCRKIGPPQHQSSGVE
jgi:hypothetical protein